MSKITLIILLLPVTLISANAEPAPALLGRLTVNQTHIVFSYAGDLWSVERSGGEARRLTTHPAEESFPVFSPDGSQIAFSRQTGGNWDISIQAPLDRPGVNVREGEYLLAINGPEIDVSQNIWTRLDGKVNEAVKITVGPNPSSEGSRTLTVFPIANEATLRLANWAEQNRRRVEESSGGKLGYIYVANYGAGILDFIRGLNGYSDRAGVIIDQRYNGGGITPDYLIEWLRRKPLYYYSFREGEDIAVPVNPGPLTKVLITNAQNYSAAETFAFMYKLAKVGPMVGARTGGGGIGPYVYTPRLIDGGNIQLPNRAAYNPDGTSWGIENIGVIPDYEVEITPKDVRAGRDPQVEKAIQVAMEEIKKNTPVSPKKPKYPVHP